MDISSVFYAIKAICLGVLAWPKKKYDKTKVAVKKISFKKEQGGYKYRIDVTFSKLFYKNSTKELPYKSQQWSGVYLVTLMNDIYDFFTFERCSPPTERLLRREILKYEYNTKNSDPLKDVWSTGKSDNITDTTDGTFAKWFKPYTDSSLGAANFSMGTNISKDQV